jgi:hypothetical protein
MLLMYADPAHTKSMTSEEIAAVKRKHERLHRELPRFGELINGASLALPEETTSLRHVQDGQPLVRAGRFSSHHPST